LGHYSDGPTVKTEYDKIKNVMTTNLPGWTTDESSMDPDNGQSNPAHIMRMFAVKAADNRRFDLMVTRTEQWTRSGNVFCELLNVGQVRSLFLLAQHSLI